MGLYYGNNRIGGIYFSTLSSGGTPITLATPTLSLASATGVVTATVTQSTSGYLSSGSTSATLNLSTQAGREITPSTATQTAVAAGKYTLGAIIVNPIPSNYVVPSGTLNITTNGTHAVTNYASVNVDVPTQGDSSISLGTTTRTYTPTETSQTETIAPPSGFDGLSSVDVTINAISSTYVGSGISRKSSSDLTVSGATVSVPAGYYSAAASKSVATGTAGTPTATKGTVSNHSISVTPSVTNTTGYITGSTKTGTAATVSASELVSGSQTITTNDTYNVTNLASVIVNVPTGSTINNRPSVSVTPTESAQTIGFDSNTYTGLSEVVVGAISSTYVGSGITSRSSSDLTVSGGTVTAPAGYYASSASASVATMTLPTAAASAATSEYTSKATISRSTADQYINIPTGYNSAGAYYKISAVANGSATGPSSLSGTSATISTGTNTITLTKTGVTTTPTVSAGYVSSATASTATVILTASVTTKAAATYHPSTNDQIIASGTYITDTQTIKAVTVSGLSASSILSGTTVKIGDSTDDDCVTSVAGSVVIQHYYTGSSAPSSSTGVDGDIYLQTS